MAYTHEEYETYLKVQHELLREDALNYVMSYLENEDDRVIGDDITEEQLKQIDLEYLVKEYEYHEDCNVAFSDTWEHVVSEYMKDFDFDDDDDYDEDF